MESSTQKRSRISDSQRSILERFYNDGMVGTGVNYEDRIESAVVSTGLTKAQVKVIWKIIL